MERKEKIALVYPHEVAEMGGLRRLIEPLTERQHPLRSAIHDVTLLLMDRIDTRLLLRPSIDIEVSLFCFCGFIKKKMQRNVESPEKKKSRSLGALRMRIAKAR